MSSQKMSNKQLVLRIKAGENVADNMLQLWQQNQGFIRSIAKKYAAYEEIEDLIQQGYFGMCNAVNGYDPENGVSFLHYASFWIRQSIHGYIEDCGKIVRLPRHFRGKLTKYKQFTAAMYAELNRRPTDQELCYYLDVGYEKLEELKRAAVLDKMGSLDVPVGENEESTLCDVVACPDCSENEILDKIQAEQLKTVIWTIVDDLPGIAPEVLRARFQEDLTLKETAARVGTTVEAVRQWQSKGLRELRKPSMSNELKPFTEHGYPPRPRKSIPSVLNRARLLQVLQKKSTPTPDGSN